MLFCPQKRPTKKTAIKIIRPQIIKRNIRDELRILFSIIILEFKIMNLEY